jgi:para-nitrobenzyl esterase
MIRTRSSSLLLPALTLRVVLMMCCLSFSAAAAAPVRIETGAVDGVPASDPSVTVYRGIPFAAPPVGDLRWRPPEPAAAWNGVRKADQFAAACIQDPVRSLGPWTEEYMHQGDYSEDCLYLNVWTASQDASVKRPVFVWIYGGAFTGGSTAVALYDGEALARKGLVVVTMNYRVGVLDFLAHPELTKESDAKSSGNYGILDQIAALRWVQKNIAAFGGDPNRVTIGGQSAGAVSVHILTASPLAKGLFHQAIAQSGSGLGNRSQPLPAAEAAGVKFVAAKGAPSLKELRAMPVATLTARVEGAPFESSPVMDGWLLPDQVTAIFAQGKQNDVATLTGWTADEGSFNENYGKRPALEFEREIRRRAGDMAVEFTKLYPVSTQQQASESQKASARDSNLISTFLWARERAKTAKTRVYTYYWDHVPPSPKKEIYQAFHSAELPYVFNSLNRANRPWEAVDRSIAETTSSYWANFVNSGDPNGPGLPKWPAFDANDPVTMELGDRFAPRPVADAAKLKMFEGMFARMAGAR